MTMPPELLLIVFLHTILQLQECFLVKYKVKEETIRLITFLTIDFMAHGARLLVNHAKNNVILHHFWFSCDFDFLMTKEVSDQVEA
jgi:hypothetical protein